MRNIIICLLIVLLTACGATEPEVIVIEVTATQMPTQTPTTTYTPEPTNSPQPTRTPKPQWDPVPISDIEEALREAGYRRHPFTYEDGMTGFDWFMGASYESFTTWDDGSFQMDVLHDKSPRVRLEHMEDKFEVLDTVLPAEFMKELREENEFYNQRVHTTCTGKPDQTFAYGDSWRTVWAEYYAEHTTIGDYDVWFSVWWWQSTCPPQYDYCYYTDFPGLEFTGDSSFAFYTIYIEPRAGTYQSSYNSS